MPKNFSSTPVVTFFCRVSHLSWLLSIGGLYMCIFSWRCETGSKARKIACLDYIPLIPAGIGLAGQSKAYPGLFYIFLFDDKANRSIVPFNWNTFHNFLRSLTKLRHDDAENFIYFCLTLQYHMTFFLNITSAQMTVTRQTSVALDV